MVESLLAACNSHLAWHPCQHKVSWHELQASEVSPTVYVSLISVPLWFAFHIKTISSGLNKNSLLNWISSKINYVRYAQLQCPRLFTSLCKSLFTTILEVRLSLRPRLSEYVDCSFYTSATSTLHSCIVTFLLDVLNTIITIRGKRKILLLVFSNLKCGIPYEVAWTTTAVLLLSYKRWNISEATCVATNEQNLMNVIFSYSGEFVKQAVVHTSSQRASRTTANIDLKLLCHRVSKYLWAIATYKRVILRHWFLSDLMMSQPQRLNNVDSETKMWLSGAQIKTRKATLGPS